MIDLFDFNHSRTAGKFTTKEPKEDNLPTMMSRFCGVWGEQFPPGGVQGPAGRLQKNKLDEI